MKIYLRNSVWYIDYFFNGKRIRYAVGAEAEALEELGRIRYEIKHGIHRPHKKLIFDNLQKEYHSWAMITKRCSSAKHDTKRYKPLLTYFSGKRIDRITHADAEEYQKRRIDGVLTIRKKKVSNATVNREVALLKHMFKKAIEWGYLKINPLRNVKMLKEPPGRIRYVKPEEWPRLISECSPELRNIVIFARHTGLRRGEIFNLQWQDIDWENRLITIGKRKNNTSIIIPVKEIVFRMLERMQKTATSAYVFPGKDGNRRYTLRTAFESACRRAGIENLRFHDLRHTFGTDLINKGEDVATVKGLMGHKSIQSTMRYVHPTLKRMRKALETDDTICDAHDTNMSQMEDE